MIEVKMSVHRDNLFKVINCAWHQVMSNQIDVADRGERNMKRSANWVDELAKAFQSEYEDRTIHRVFWKNNEENKRAFGLNEFLFDVMVCSISSVQSLQPQSNQLEFIDECHWQVESEFNVANSRKIITDMSKLVVGSAENKLFIAAHRSSTNQHIPGNKDILNMCARIARRCIGKIYFGFVMHPDNWPKNPVHAVNPDLYEWQAGDWEPI